MGYTRDLSEAGLSIIVPTLQLGDDRIDVKDYPLRLIVSLPQGIIIAQARTVRSEVNETPNGARTFLLGLAVTKMNDRDRANYRAYLRSLT